VQLVLYDHAKIKCSSTKYISNTSRRPCQQDVSDVYTAVRSINCLHGNRRAQMMCSLILAAKRRTLVTQCVPTERIDAPSAGRKAECPRGKLMWKLDRGALRSFLRADRATRRSGNLN